MPHEWAVNIREVLFSQERIQTMVRAMAADINREYAGKGKLLVVGLLKGAVCFMVDLLRHLTVPHEIDFMVLSSYGNKTSSSGTVKLKKDLGVNPEGRHLLIVEDLIDTGGTLKWLKEYLSEKRAASVRIACLLNKSAGRRADLRDLKVDFVGDECPDEFVVGYGMDFAGEYRCMPFVGVLKKSAYA